MTISSQTRKVGPFTGDDATTVFPFAFKVFDDADLLVVRLDTTTSVETTLTLTTDYTVALNTNQNANPGGTVTLTAPLATGTTLVVASSLGYLQPTDLTNQGGFYPRVISDALDRLTILSQQLKEEVDRAAKVSIAGGTDAATLVENINNLAAVLDNINTVATPYQSFDGDGATLAFTLSSAPGSLGAVEVYVGGLNMVPGTDYTLNDSTLSFTAAPAVGVGNIFVRWVAVQAITRIVDGSVSTAKLAASAVTTTTIAAGAVITSRLADSAVTSVKLDAAGVVLPTGSTVYVPDITDDSAKPAPTSWVKDLTATDTRAGIVELATDAETQTGTDTARAVTPANLKATRITRGAAVATTSGTTKDFTGIPSWVTRVTVVLAGVSTTDTDPMLLQLGDSGGIETSSYVSVISAGATVAQAANGFLVSANSAGTTSNFCGAIHLYNCGSNLWICSGVTGSNGAYITGQFNGQKTLSDTLDRVRLTTFTGTATFDAGAFYVFYE